MNKSSMWARWTAARRSGVVGLAAGSIVGLSVAGAVTWSNPAFVDSFWQGLVFIWALPAIAGAVAWSSVTGVWRRWRRGRKPADSESGRRPLKIVWALFAASAVGVIGLRVACFLDDRPRPAEGGGGRVLVVGMDGATWSIIDRMTEKGELPNIASLRQRGATGSLLSIEPSLSPALWTTLATGKTRAQHGILGFNHTQAHLKVPRVWELLEAEGKKVGVFSWLVTWPPRVRNGFMVPGWMARTSETQPAELGFAQRIVLGVGLDRSVLEYAGYLADAPRHGVRLSTLTRAAWLVVSPKIFDVSEADLTYRKEMLKTRIYTDTFAWLLRRDRPEFSAFVFYGTDLLAHLYWKFMEPPADGGVDAADLARYGTVIEDYYRLADASLGRFMDSLPANTSVCIVSDHGHGPATVDGIRQFSLKGEQLVEALGMSAELAVASVGQWVYLTPAPDRGVDVLERAIGLLSAVTVDRTGSGLLSIDFAGPGSLALMPTPDLQPGDTVTLPGEEMRPVDEFVSISDSLSGTHRLEGILLLAGAGIKQGYQLEGASVLDVTPTLLYLMGSAVGQDMDGRLLTSAIEEQFLAGNSPIEVDSRDADVDFVSIGSPDEEMPAEVLERLRSLGYVN